MRFWVRLVLSLVGLLFVIGGIYVIALAFDLAGQVYWTSLGPIIGDLRYALLGVGAVAVGAVLLTAGWRTSIQKETTGFISQYTNLGELRISFKAIESMVLRAARQVQGIRETTTNIISTEQGLIIFLKIKVLPDLKIPILVEELQGKVRNYVQDLCGTSVVEVKVLVDNMLIEQSIVKK